MSTAACTSAQLKVAAWTAPPCSSALLQGLEWQPDYASTLATYYNVTLDTLTSAQVGKQTRQLMTRARALARACVCVCARATQGPY